MFYRLKQILGIKSKVTQEELADVYWYVCKKLSNVLDADLRSSSEIQANSEKPNNMLMVEEIIFNLWVISKVCSQDAQVLDKLHSKFIGGLPNIFGQDAEKIAALKELLNTRYRQYYAAWETPSEGGLKLYGVASDFLDNIRQYTKLSPTNIMMNMQISSHIGSAMQFIQKTRNDYVVV